VPHRVTYRVYYEDTDSLGVVYYANYFRFFERGRTEYLAARGHEVAALNATGIVVAVHAVTAKFRRSARLGETIDVVTSFSVESPYRGRFDQRIERGGELLVEASVDVVCTTSDQQLIELPDLLRSAVDR
jgi:tol-pal system-associated acyl-CoA thioesterase